MSTTQTTLSDNLLNHIQLKEYSPQWFRDLSNCIGEFKAEISQKNTLSENYWNMLDLLGIRNALNECKVEVLQEYLEDKISSEERNYRYDNFERIYNKLKSYGIKRKFNTIDRCSKLKKSTYKYYLNSKIQKKF